MYYKLGRPESGSDKVKKVIAHRWRTGTPSRFAVPA